MEEATKSKIRQFLLNQIAQSTSQIHSLTLDINNNSYPKRQLVFKIEEYIKNYQQKKTDSRWIVIPGLRGVGKTTLLAQVYENLDCSQDNKLFVSLDELKNVLRVGLVDLLDTYEEILGNSFEALKSSVYLFLDEVQYEEDWAVILKTIYDRTRKVFIICSGSSALLLQTNADIGRRSDIMKLYPLSFTEYRLIKFGKDINENLGNNIKEAIFNSNDATQVYTKLKALQKDVTKEWIINRMELDKYIKYGTLPFAIGLEEGNVYSKIKRIFDTIRTKDIPQVKKFDPDTVEKIGAILYALSSSDVVGLNKFGRTMNVAENTIRDLFEVFVLSELLIKVKPYASHFGQVKRPSKYLFLSSAYRSMFFNAFGSIMTYDQYKGRLLEDIVALYLHKILDLSLGAILNYDMVQGGADYIVRFVNEKKIAIEVGYGTKGFMQVRNTMKRIDCAYGISLSQSTLALGDTNNSVSIPLEYFLLI